MKPKGGFEKWSVVDFMYKLSQTEARFSAAQGGFEALATGSLAGCAGVGQN